MLMWCLWHIFLSVLKHIKCDSIEFCSVQKGRENVFIYMHIYTHMYMSKQFMHVLLHAVKMEHIKSLLAESRA